MMKEKELLKRIISIVICVGLKMLVYYWLIKLAKKYNTSIPKVSFIKENEESCLLW